jgi:hypothetical protein
MLMVVGTQAVRRIEDEMMGLGWSAQHREPPQRPSVPKCIYAEIIKNILLAADGFALVDCGHVVDAADAVVSSAIDLHQLACHVSIPNPSTISARASELQMHSPNCAVYVSGVRKNTVYTA